MNGPQDLGGMMGFGPIAPETERASVPCRMGTPRLGAHRLPWAHPASGTSTCRAMPAREFRQRSISSSSYYEIWMDGLTKLLVEYGLANEKEIATGRMSGRR